MTYTIHIPRLLLPFLKHTCKRWIVFSKCLLLWNIRKQRHKVLQVRDPICQATNGKVLTRKGLQHEYFTLFCSTRIQPNHTPKLTSETHEALTFWGPTTWLLILPAAPGHFLLVTKTSFCKGGGQKYTCLNYLKLKCKVIFSEHTYTNYTSRNLSLSLKHNPSFLNTTQF